MNEDHRYSTRSATLRLPTLAPAQRRRLDLSALSWVAISSALIKAFCTGVPWLFATLLHGTPSLLTVLCVAVGVALGDVALVGALFYGLALLLEGLRGRVVQSVEVLHDRPIASARLLRAVHCGRAGVLRAATPTLLADLRWGESYTIIYSPRARVLWACAPTLPTEEAN